MRARPAPAPACDRTKARSRGPIRLKSTRSLKCLSRTQLRVATLVVKFRAQTHLVPEVLLDELPLARTRHDGGSNPMVPVSVLAETATAPKERVSGNPPTSPRTCCPPRDVWPGSWASSPPNWPSTQPHTLVTRCAPLILQGQGANSVALLVSAGLMCGTNNSTFRCRATGMLCHSLRLNDPQKVVRPSSRTMEQEEPR